MSIAACNVHLVRQFEIFTIPWLFNNGLDYYLLDGNVYTVLILYHENQTGVFEQTVAARKQYFTSK